MIPTETSSDITSWMLEEGNLPPRILDGYLLAKTKSDAFRRFYVLENRHMQVPHRLPRSESPQEPRAVQRGRDVLSNRF